ncbi:hypothetical protein [Bacillus sp. T33-2]|uniref:hypothetical protein n=1 Tax=Bacillus sp. T33-2 TaxID=2054168 RepID=UPI0015E0DD15|nr:hypothetical protein [Bacillus sp. T33-2]
MLKKMIESILKQKLNKRHYSSSDRHRHHRHTGHGHHYYKRKHGSKGFFSRGSSFFSS